jgi:hypothetical protein
MFLSGNRATTCTDKAPAWLSESQRFLCSVLRESALPIFLHWSNCDWTCWKTGCYPNWIPIMTITFYNWTQFPPHFHTCVRVILYRVLPQRWIGHASNGDNNLLPWPPRSPDLTPCDFFLWGFVRDSVYVPPLSTPIQEFSGRMTHALQAITADMLHWVWDEIDCHVDLCYVTQGHALKDCN